MAVSTNPSTQGFSKTDRASHNLTQSFIATAVKQAMPAAALLQQVSTATRSITPTVAQSTTLSQSLVPRSSSKILVRTSGLSSLVPVNRLTCFRTHRSASSRRVVPSSELSLVLLS